MVAVTRVGSSFSRAFLYNQRKVRIGDARLIHAGNFLEELESLDAYGIRARFARLNELNQRTRLNTIHSSLNFHPAEKLQDHLLSSVSSRYAEMLGLAGQPLLVYRHTDAGHPHVHLVSTLINTEGKRITIPWPVQQFSREACKKIEREFSLLAGPVNDHARPLTDEPPQKIRYGETPLRQSMERVLGKILTEFHFGSIEDFNALLEQYNLYADRRSENSRTFRRGGLVYQALDENGNRVGVPVKASVLATKSGFRQIVERIEGSKSCLEAKLDSVKGRIDWTLLQCEAAWSELVENLRQEDIRLLHEPGQSGEAVFLDLRQRAVFRSAELGPAYSVSALKTRLELSQEPASVCRSNACLYEDEDVSSLVPQMACQSSGEEGAPRRQTVSYQIEPFANNIECSGEHTNRMTKR